MNRKRAVKWLVSLATFIAVAPIVAPQLLAFPYHARSGAHEVWSESPLPNAELVKVLDRSNRLVAASPLARGQEGRHIFLTNGGWRWHWLALSSAQGFGLTRPVSEAVVINRSDLAMDRSFSARYGKQFGGLRTLSGVIAHEITHGMIRRHFGQLSARAKPRIIVEGYCDYVAQEGSLSDADAAELDRTGQSHPALIYYHGRKRVAAALAANGGSVDKLFVDAAKIAAAKSNQN
jgi:hypothetical protein